MRLPDFPFVADLHDTFPKASAYLVGGAVRDVMMKRGTKDYDFVIRNVSSKELKRFLAKRGKVDLVGRHFGVFKFRPLGSDRVYDIALPRTEKAGMTGGYRDFDVQSDPELPLEKDLARRDFTVNAMAWDLKRERLIDPFGGKSDLKKKIIRAVGAPDRRFQEDHSRMLRALRFAVTLKFKIEKKTWAALARHMSHLNDTVDGRRTVPYEVVAREFLKSFNTDPLKTVDFWQDAGALSAVAPGLGDVHARLNRVLHQPHVYMHHHIGPVVALASIFAPLGARAAGSLVDRLKFSSVEGSRVTPTRVRRVIAGGKAAILKEEGVKPLLSASEVMAILNLKPGPEVGKALDRLLVAQAKGSIRTKAQARKWLKK